MIAQDTLRKFLNMSFMKMHACAFVGFMVGVKLCDQIFFDEVVVVLNDFQILKKNQIKKFHNKPKK